MESSIENTELKGEEGEEEEEPLLGTVPYIQNGYILQYVFDVLSGGNLDSVTDQRMDRWTDQRNERATYRVVCT